MNPRKNKPSLALTLGGCVLEPYPYICHEVGFLLLLAATFGGRGNPNSWQTYGWDSKTHSPDMRARGDFMAAMRTRGRE